MTVEVPGEEKAGHDDGSDQYDCWGASCAFT